MGSRGNHIFRMLFVKSHWQSRIISELWRSPQSVLLRTTKWFSELWNSSVNVPWIVSWHRWLIMWLLWDKIKTLSKKFMPHPTASALQRYELWRTIYAAWIMRIRVFSNSFKIVGGPEKGRFLKFKELWIRLFPTLISKMKWVGSGLSLKDRNDNFEKLLVALKRAEIFEIFRFENQGIIWFSDYQ